MGEAALLLELGAEIDVALNARVHALARALASVPAILETIPGYASLLVEFDPTRLGHTALQSEILRLLHETPVGQQAPRVVEIPTRYGGEFGPDLEFVARHNGRSPEEVIALHSAQPWRVFMLGFAPGFPYAGPLPDAIAAPRLETPRPRTPAGAVGIAGKQTGIYPRESPGGWRIIGRTDVRLFDPLRDPPVLVRPGDYLRFLRVDD